MKKVLISIHPRWCAEIFNGQKTIEVRKSFPRQLETPFKVYVYQTKIRFKVRDWQENFQSIIFTPNGGAEDGNGKVIGSFVCDKKYNIFRWGIGVAVTNEKNEIMSADILRKGSCLSDDEICDYVGNGEAYGWHITEPKLFDEPRELGEFYTICNKYGDDSCGDCPYLAVEQCSFPCDDCVDTWCSVDNIKPITRPPQSWCYVEELQ